MWQVNWIEVKKDYNFVSYRNWVLVELIAVERKENLDGRISTGHDGLWVVVRPVACRSTFRWVSWPLSTVPVPVPVGFGRTCGFQPLTSYYSFLHHQHHQPISLCVHICVYAMVRGHVPYPLKLVKASTIIIFINPYPFTILKVGMDARQYREY